MQTLSILKVKLLRFNLSDEHLGQIWEGHQDGKIHLFRLLDTIISNKYIDTAKNHNIIAELCSFHFDYYSSNKQIDLETLAARIGYTREHLRNIKNDFNEKFHRKFNFLFDLDFIEEIQLDSNENILIFPQDLIARLNKENHTAFTRKFISRIYSLFNKQYVYLGDDANPDWKEGYLINKELNQGYVKLLNEYRIRLRPYPLRYDDQIWTFSEMESFSAEGAKMDIVRRLVHHEFPKEKVTEEGLFLPKTKSPNLDEKLVSVFLALGPDRHGYELDNIVESLERDKVRTYKKSSVRGILNTSPYFSAFGKKSTYVLTEWLDIPELDIIAGDYWRVCQSILEREAMPLDSISMLKKLAYYRRDPDKKSINSMLRKDKKVFRFRSGFVALLDHVGQMDFLEKIQILPRAYYSRTFWKRFESQDDVYQFFSKKGLHDRQISYLIAYIAENEGIQNLPTNVVQAVTHVPPQRTVEELTLLLDQISELDGSFGRTKVRREHVLLKQILFHGRSEMECAICSKVFPVKLLAVAHIKRRSMATDQERKNAAIVMAACFLGCDALFEKGYICVNGAGMIEVHNKVVFPTNLVNYLWQFDGKPCKIYNNENSTFFRSHYAFHQRRQF
jgi:hypothetical protein